jgi:hypothetical protein
MIPLVPNRPERQQAPDFNENWQNHFISEDEDE